MIGHTKLVRIFLALSTNNYYNDYILHRNIKGVMVETGHLTGKGR